MSDIIKKAISAIYGRKSNNPVTFKSRNNRNPKAKSHQTVWVVLAMTIVFVCLVALFVGIQNVHASDQPIPPITGELPQYGDLGEIWSLLLPLLGYYIYAFWHISKVPPHQKKMAIIYFGAIGLVMTIMFIAAVSMF